MKNFTQVNRALAAEKNFYINLNQIKSNPDGQTTVNRQSRLMSHQGKALRNVQMSRCCPQPDSVSNPCRCRVLATPRVFSAVFTARAWKYVAMIFAVLTLSIANIGMAWGKYLYLNTANLTDWEGDNATFKLYPGTGSDVTGVKVYDHMYRFDVPKATGTMYFKRYNSTGATLWNQFPVDYNASYNVYKVTSWDRDGCSKQCSSGTYDNSITMKEIYLDVHTKWYQDSPLFKLTVNSKTYASTVFAGTNLILFSVPSPSGNLYFERWKSDNSTRWNTAETTYNSSYNAYEITDWGVVSGNYNVKIVDKPNYIYFDNSQIAFGTSNAYVVVGHDKPTAYSSTYAFGTKPIANTKLYYYNNTGNTWRDATYYAFLQNSSSFGGGSWGSSNLSKASKYTAAYTTATDLSWDKLYLFIPASGSNGAALSLQTATAASGLNNNQTVKYALSIDGGETFTDMSSGKTPGQISISAYKFVDGTYNGVSSGSQSISGGTTGTYSKSVPAAYTGKTTYSEGSTQTGYTFVGWHDGTSDLGTSNYTDYPTSAKTITARFKADQVTITLNGNSGTGHTASVKATYGVSTLPSITNPTRDGYVFAGWFTGTGGTGKLVIDIDGSLQPGISSYTDADGNWLKTSNVTLYAAWLTVHEPGVYTSTYGQDLTVVSNAAYEVYRYAVNSSTIFLNAGGETAPTVFDEPRRLFSFSQTGTAGACDITWSGWVGHTQVYGKGTNTTTASGEFKAHSVCQPTCRDQQGVIMCVSGYSQFSIYAQDADNTGKKHFKVFINGVEQAMTLNKGFTVRRFDLTPANTYVIRVTGQTDNNNLIQGISLKVPCVDFTVSRGGQENGTYTVGSYDGNALTCTPSVSGTYTYQWKQYKQGDPNGAADTINAVGDGANTASFTPNPASAGTYYYMCRVLNACGDKQVTSTTGTFTFNATSCGATAPGEIGKGTLNACTLSLTASGSPASNNTWYWQASADGTSTSESGTTKDVTSPGTYYIRSYYSTGSCWSDAVSVTVTASDLTPAAPSALGKSSITAKGVTLAVTDAANTNDYEFYVSTSSSAPGSGTSASYTSTSKSVTITDLYAGTTFYAWARAKCGSNKSAWTALGDGGTFTTSTVTVTHTLTNVSKTSGATTAGGSDYTAAFAAASGYSMPTPTVTIDGNTATSGTDYTWSSGTLTIPANKINGNIVITLNSAAAAPSSVAITGNWLYFAGETIELTATPTGGNGPVTYQWYKGGKENGNAIEGATTATYTKATCAFEDAGSYYCKVTCGGSQSTWGQSGNAYNVKIPRLYVKTGHFYDPVKTDFGNVDFTRVNGSTATASIVLGSNRDYCFNINDGCGNYYGNSGTMQYNNYGPWTTNVNPQDCGLRTTNGATYVFTINYSNWEQLTTTVTYPVANQAADKVIYFDNNDRNWSTLHYRIGRTDHTQATAMTKVPGTANLYKVTTAAYNNFTGWHIANNAGWTGDNNSIYRTYTEGDGYSITYATAHEGGAVTESAVTVTPTTSRGNGSDVGINDNCEFYNYTITSGMKTDNVSITAPSNGTITVNYDDVSGAAQTFSSGNRDLAHTCIITVTAVPAAGYSEPATVSINGASHGNRDPYTITGTTVVAATFSPASYTVTLNTNGGTINAGNVTSYTYGTGATLPTNVTKDGFTFDGWYDNSGLTGSAVTTISTTVTGNKEYWAKWTEDADACYEFAPTQTSGDIADAATIATSTGGTMVKNGGTISYTTKGIYFQSNSSSIVTVTLDNNMQAGTVITAIFTNGESTKAGRGVKLCTNSSTDAVGDWKWNPSAEDEEKEFSYIVTDKGTFDGTNVFRLIRQGNVYLKSVTVTGCAEDVCSDPVIDAGTTNTSFAGGSWAAGSGHNITITATGADSYEWYRNTSASREGATKLSATGHNIDVTTEGSPVAGTTYYFQAVAIKGDCSSTSAWSGAMTITASGHTVTYNYNGATSGASPASATGASVTLPNPTRTGYELDGWYTTDGTRIKAGGETYSPTADITLYARWQKACAGAGSVATFNFNAGNSTGLTIETNGANATYSVVNSKTNNIPVLDSYFLASSFKNNASGIITITTDASYTDIDSIKLNSAATDNADPRIAIFTVSGETETKQQDAFALSSGSVKTWRATPYKKDLSSSKPDGKVRFKLTTGGAGKSAGLDNIQIFYGGGSGTCRYIYYHGNGATSGFVSDTTSYADDAKATVLGYNDSRYPLTKDDYDFQGWAITAGGSVAYSAGEKITIDGADVHLYAKWAPTSSALVNWTMGTNTSTWSATATSTTDGTNITSIGTARTNGSDGVREGATAKVTMATAEVTGSAAPSNSANFTFTIGATMQVEISKFDCKVFNVNSGNRTYKAQISDAAGNVYNSTNTVAVSTEATLTDASFVFGSTKILRGAVTIRVYAWDTDDNKNPTEFRMGPDVKFYGTVENYACATPSEPTISGVSEYVPGQTITLTASHDGENYDNLTTYTWYKGDTWGSKSKVQNAATGSAGYTFTKASCAAGDADKYWCEVANGTCNAHNSEGYNIIVYPTYTITYNLDGGTNPVDPAPKTSYTQFDEDYTLPVPTKADAIFAGWYEAGDFSGVPAVILESGSVGDKQYWAKWGTAVTATWTITKVDDALYRGGSGYKVKAVIDQATWDNAFKDDLELTATEGVTLKNIVKDEYTSGSDNGKTYVTADFDITTVVPANATQITFTLSVPADGTYAPAELPHNEALTDCSGGVVEVRFLSSEKNDAGENFADMENGSSQLVGNGIAKVIAVGDCKILNDTKKVGYRSDRSAVVFKLTTTSSLDVYYNASSTSRSFALYSFSSAKGLSEIVPSDYSSKTTITSVSAEGASWENTPAGGASISSGVISLSGSSGGIKATYSSLSAGYYVLLSVSNEGYFYGFDVDGGAGGGGPVTPTLTWTPELNTDEDWKPANTRLEKETGDVDFTFVAVQDKNSLGAITYSSSNTSVATVNATGTVHIVGAQGDATITATLAASGCFEEATATYNIHVEDNCIDEPGTITTRDLGCSGIEMTVSGHTTSGETVSYQWYKVGTPDEAIFGATEATYTATAAGEYYVVVTNIGTDHCPMASTNTVKVASKAAATATKIVDQWYVKKDRRTPDVELVQTKGATGFTVKIGEETIWDEANSNTTGFAGCGFHMGENGIIYLNGTKDNGDAPAHDDGTWAAGDVTLKITANDGCGNSASELSIIIHKQAKTDRPSIAFVVDGTKDGEWNAVTSGHASGTDLYDYLNYNESTNPTGAFDLTERNIYHTTNEKDIREEYSQYDAILITDDPSTNTTPSGDYKTKGYVNAFGTMVDVRPILTMEAYVSALKNWSAKGIAGNPSSPNPRQYEIRLECKDHEIYKSGLPEAEDGTNVWDEVIGDDIFRHVILVDSTKGIYNGVAYNVETAGDKKPALQGFNGSAAGSLLGLGRILDGTLQAAIERQEEPAARLLVMGVNAKALRPTSALTPEGKIVIRNILTYLLKTNMEEVDDCSNYFTGATDDDWNKATNWSKGGLPSNEAKVRILAPCVVKNGNKFHVAQVDIATKGTSSKKVSGAANGNLTIEAGGALIVGGKIRSAEAPYFAANDLKPTTPKDLIINTNGSAQAALIFDNEEAETQATVNLYSLGRVVSSTYQFQYMAVPMEVVSVYPSFANETHGGKMILTYVWKENGGWERRGYYEDLRAFEGVGITTGSTSAMNYTMKGNLASTSQKEIALTNTNGSGAEYANNIIGNSWTAPIDIASLKTAIGNDNNVQKTIYIYVTGNDGDGGASSGTSGDAGQWLAVPIDASGWSGWSGLKVIPAMQAFLIRVNAETSLELNYKEVVRKTATENLNEPLRAPRRAAADKDITMTTIHVADSKTYADLRLFEGKRFDEEFDNGWEAEYLPCDGRTATLYAETEAGQMAVAALPELEGTVLGFAPGKETEYTFTFLGGNEEYYLNDLKLKNSTLMSAENSYTFTFEEGDTNRFYISRTAINSPAVATGMENLDAAAPKAQKIIYNDKLYIIRGGRLYDATGKVVK